MKVYEIKTKIFLMKDLSSNDAQVEICKIIDATLAKDKNYLEFHKKINLKTIVLILYIPFLKIKHINATKYIHLP